MSTGTAPSCVLRSVAGSFALPLIFVTQPMGATPEKSRNSARSRQAAPRNGAADILVEGAACVNRPEAGYREVGACESGGHLRL